MKKNISGQVIGAHLISKTDGSDVTTGTTTVYVTGDNGTQATGSGTVAHKGNGFWTYSPTQAETNYNHVAFTFVNSSAVSVTVQVYTNYPQSGDSYPTTNTNLDTTVSSRAPASTALSNTTWTDTKAGYVDIAISSRSTLTASDVWNYATRTLSSFGTLVSDIWNYATRTLTSFGTLVSDIWSATTRSLTDKSGFNLASDQSSVTIGIVNALGTQAKADVNAEVDSALDTAIPTNPTPNSINERIKTIDDKLPANYIMGSSVTTDKDDEIDAIKAKTDQLTFTIANRVDANALQVGDKTGYAIGTGGISSSAFAANAIDAAALATDAAAEIADKLLGRNIAGGVDGGRTVRDALRMLRNKRAVAGGTLTVYQEDDSTSAWTATVTTAAGNPVTTIDPT
jgi:hypothetical protein